MRRALAMGGTCTGEHGVGYGKIKYMEAEHGAALDVMRTIKRALDPDNRMNPGKVLDASRGGRAIETAPRQGTRDKGQGKSDSAFGNTRVESGVK